MTLGVPFEACPRSWKSPLRILLSVCRHRQRFCPATIIERQTKKLAGCLIKSSVSTTGDADNKRRAIGALYNGIQQFTSPFLMKHLEAIDVAQSLIRHSAIGKKRTGLLK